MTKRKYKLKRYEETVDDSSAINFTKYKIIVPTKRDKKELLEASRYLHDLRCIDTDYITVNQLVHEYELVGDYSIHSDIIVDKELFEKLNS